MSKKRNSRFNPLEPPLVNNFEQWFYDVDYMQEEADDNADETEGTAPNKDDTLIDGNSDAKSNE